jgi:hypothetical protein
LAPASGVLLVVVEDGAVEAVVCVVLVGLVGLSVTIDVAVLPTGSSVVLTAGFPQPPRASVAQNAKPTSSTAACAARQDGNGPASRVAARRLPKCRIAICPPLVRRVSECITEAASGSRVCAAAVVVVAH